MNDFSELENELRNLRPARPSPILFERIEEALADRRASAAASARWNWWRLTQTPYSLGFGLAAAAVLVLFAAISLERRQEQGEKIAQTSTCAGNKTGFSSPPQWERRLHILRSIYSCWRDAGCL